MPQPIANPTELRLPALLKANEGLTGREVVAAHKEALPLETLSQASAYTALGRMGDKGWVKASAPTGEDGRIRIFRSTARGEKVAKASREFYEALAAFEPDHMLEKS